MLNRRALLVFAALSLTGCGGPHVDAKAQESVERLDGPQRMAAQVLVQLESAARDENASTLCSRVYAYTGSRRQCERAFRELLEHQRSMALEVRDVQLRGNTAVAHAAVTTLDNGGERRTDEYTYQLVKAGNEWKVKFQ